MKTKKQASDSFIADAAEEIKKIVETYKEEFLKLRKKQDAILKDALKSLEKKKIEHIRNKIKEM